MRFVSPHPRFTVNLRNPIEEPDPYHAGRQVVAEKGIQAQFIPGDYTFAEKEYALKRFKFNGLPTIEGNPDIHVDPSYRIGTFDTDLQGYDEETKAFVEEAMQTAYSYGSDFELFEAPKLPAPWAGYDKLRSAKRIADLVGETGSDVEDVIAYERENGNRPDVISALEGLLVTADEGETVISA